MAEGKESSEESCSSFWTTPADDSFRFSNLSTGHMSVLKESGPFVAIVLSCWDNVLGPRLQHVWRGAGDTESQVRLIYVVVIPSPLSSPGGPGGGGATWVKSCWVCTAGISEPQPHYGLFLVYFVASYKPHLNHF